MEFASFWASDGALADSQDMIIAGAREAARRAGGKVTRDVDSGVSVAVMRNGTSQGDRTATARIDRLVALASGP